MYSLPEILYAALDSEILSLCQIKSWADELIEKIDNPSIWLIDISFCQSLEECEKILARGLRKVDRTLHGDLDDLIVGLILLRYDKGEISEMSAKAKVIENLDAYDSKILDPEAAGNLKLNAEVYSKLRIRAEQSLAYLKSGDMLKREQDFLSC